MPDAIIIAGPNGAGKSTILPTIQRMGRGSGPYEPNPIEESKVIDPDKLAKEGNLGDFEAGRAAILKTRRLVAEGHDFALETTLVGSRVLRLIDRLRASRYRVYLVYLWLPDVELSVARTVQRGLRGSHYIPLPTLIRRYQRSMANFTVASQKVDFWVAVDNSSTVPSISGWGGDLMGDAVFSREPESLKALMEALAKTTADGADGESARALFDLEATFDHADFITPEVLERIRKAVVEEIARQPQECVCTWKNGRLTFEEWRSSMAPIRLDNCP